MSMKDGEREKERGRVMKGYVEGKGLGWVELKVEDIFDQDLERRLRALDGSAIEHQDVGKESGMYSIDLKRPGELLNRSLLV